MNRTMTATRRVDRLALVDRLADAIDCPRSALLPRVEAVEADRIFDRLLREPHDRPLRVPVQMDVKTRDEHQVRVAIVQARQAVGRRRREAERITLEADAIERLLTPDPKVTINIGDHE